MNFRDLSAQHIFSKRNTRSYSMKQDAVVISNYEWKYREKWRADNE